MGTQPAQQPLPTFGSCLLWPNGRPSQQLLSSFSCAYVHMYTYICTNYNYYRICILLFCTLLHFTPTGYNLLRILRLYKISVAEFLTSKSDSVVAQTSFMRRSVHHAVLSNSKFQCHVSRVTWPGDEVTGVVCADRGRYVTGDDRHCALPHVVA